MGAFLGALILLFGGFAFGRTWSHVRQRAWAGPRSTGMRQRAAPGARPRTVRQEGRLAWEKVRAANWLEQQRHHRKNGTQAGAVASVTPLARARASAQARLRPAPSAGGGGGNGAPATPAAVPGSPSPPARPAPATAPPTGRTTTVASNGSAPAAEKFIEGVNQIHGEAAAGGLHAKHAAVKACVEGAMRFSSMLAMMARAMSEPGANYGPEITEPLAKMATHMQAAAMAGSESDANMSTLVNMTVGDLANSARQAPHHAELSEDGSR